VPVVQPRSISKKSNFPATNQIQQVCWWLRQWWQVWIMGPAMKRVVLAPTFRRRAIWRRQIVRHSIPGPVGVTRARLVTVIFSCRHIFFRNWNRNRTLFENKYLKRIQLKFVYLISNFGNECGTKIRKLLIRKYKYHIFKILIAKHITVIFKYQVISGIS